MTEEMGKPKAKRPGKRKAKKKKIRKPRTRPVTPRARPRDLSPAGPDIAAVAAKAGCASQGDDLDFPDDDEPVQTPSPPKSPDHRLPANFTTVQRKCALIEHVASSGDEVNGAARALGIDRKTVYRWKAEDKVFAEALDFAYRNDGTQSLVSVAVKRAVEGWDEPVWFKGKLCGYVRKYDHGLLMFLIRKRDPSYRDPKYIMEAETMKLPGDVTINLDKATPAERAVIRKMAERQAKGAKGEGASR